jgi:hypothetical protein
VCHHQPMSYLPCNVLVTCSATEGLFAACLALLNPGDGCGRSSCSGSSRRHARPAAACCSSPASRGTPPPCVWQQRCPLSSGCSPPTSASPCWRFRPPSNLTSNRIHHAPPHAAQVQRLLLSDAPAQVPALSSATPRRGAAHISASPTLQSIKMMIINSPHNPSGVV